MKKIGIWIWENGIRGNGVIKESMVDGRYILVGILKHLYDGNSGHLIGQKSAL